MKAHTLEYIESEFKKYNYKLLSKVYINSKQKLEYICTNGHINTILYNDLKNGHGCSICSGKKKYDYDYVKTVFEENGCILLSNKYINNKQNLEYICKCGKRSYIRFDKVSNGIRCITCGGTEKLTFEYVKQYFLDNGCELLSTEYKDSHQKLDYICKCGNESKIRWANFQQGQRCYKCGRKEFAKKQLGDKNHMWNPNREQVELNKRVGNICRELIYRTLESTGKRKTGHTYDLLGYNKEQLLEHLQKDPLYTNWLNKSNPHKYHIDHIIPVKAFTDHNILDPKIINKLSNLQILPGPENGSKSDNYLEDDFIFFMENNNVFI